MRCERASLHTPKVSVGRLPPRELSDGVVRLRIPTLADIDRVARYGADPMLLEDIWIPGPRPGQDLHEWASAFVQELLAGWTAVGGIHGGGLIVVERETFLVIAYLAPRSALAVELLYGVASHARGRAIATWATRLAAEWALTEVGSSRSSFESTSSTATANASPESRLSFRGALPDVHRRDGQDGRGYAVCTYEE